jgi:hypothetical protein
MKWLQILIVAGVMIVPSSALAAPIFSEIAWMGTVEDANNEWIEIYNFSSQPTDVNGWTISDGGSLNITLTGVMPPHGVFLLERTDDTSVPNVAATIIYTGALANTGATLTLRNANGEVVGAPLVGGQNWENIGGNNELKYTAQFTMSGTWVTGTPTPGLPNIEKNTEVPKTTGTTTSGGAETTTKTATPATRTGSGERVSLKPANNELVVSITAPQQVYVNQPILFVAEPTGVGDTIMNSLVYTWNLGDLETAVGKNVRHTYTHPGEYVVVVEAVYAERRVVTRHVVTVSPVTLRIMRTATGDIALHNEASNEIDVSGYTLVGDTALVMPKNTIILQGGTLTISAQQIEQGTAKFITLYDQKKNVAASLLPIALTALPAAPIALASYTQPIIKPAATVSRPVVRTTSTAANPAAVTATATPPTIAENIELALIPIGSAQAASVFESTSPLTNRLPYVGLVLVILLGIVALYIRRV